MSGRSASPLGSSFPTRSHVGCFILPVACGGEGKQPVFCARRVVVFCSHIIPLCLIPCNNPVPFPRSFNCCSNPTLWFSL